MRARLETRSLLRELAREEGATVIDTLDRLVKEAAEARLLEAVAADLSSAPAHDEKELAGWDVSLEDGLDPGEDFASWR